MSVINNGEILARIHRFKILRKEGNLFVDVYEALWGKHASKFIAVPNLIIQEADKKYFGFGNSKAEALKDCLKKIKDVPIHAIVHLDDDLKKNRNRGIYTELLDRIKRPLGIDVKQKINIPSPSLGKIFGHIADYTRPNSFMGDIFEARGKKWVGVPIKNAKITAICKGVGKMKTKTDDSGYYEFTGLADGVWILKIKAKGFEVKETKVMIVGGGEYEENFE